MRTQSSVHYTCSLFCSKINYKSIALNLKLKHGCRHFLYLVYLHFIDIVKYFLFFHSVWHFLLKPTHLCMKPEHTEKQFLSATFDNSFIFVSSIRYIKDLAFMLESVVLMKKCYIHFTHWLTVTSFRGTTGNKNSTYLKDTGSTPQFACEKCTKSFIYFSSQLL